MTSGDGTRPTEGWVRLDNAVVRHYIGEDGHSLCGRWAYFGDEFDPSYDTRAKRTDCCKGCMTKLTRRRARAAK